MKAFFVLCTVFSVAFANVTPDVLDLEFDVLEVDEFDLFEDKKEDFPVTDEQVQCVKDKTKKVVDENPALENWYKDTEKSGLELLAKAKDCFAKSGLKKKFCEAKLTVSALSFYRKTKKTLPKGYESMMEEFKGYVTDCTGIKIPIV